MHLNLEADPSTTKVATALGFQNFENAPLIVQNFFLYFTYRPPFLKKIPYNFQIFMYSLRIASQENFSRSTAALIWCLATFIRSDFR